MSGAGDATTGLEIAIVGMSCEVPGARSPEAFWENLRAGKESISVLGDEELRAAGVPQALLDHPAYVRAAGVLGDVGRFDASFFGYTPREAQIIDPQQRRFLERASEALERAGLNPTTFPGAIGVFAGASLSSYLHGLATNAALRGVVSGFDLLLGSDKDFLATRAAYKLGLNGPAVAVQSACSTSLAAVHLACQSLLAGESDVALAGGASIHLPEAKGYLYEPDGILSRDGHSRTFDAAASGTVRGNGVGVVVLKRLADARRDGDRISAVIKGSAMNNDGSRRVGFTAPGVEGQARVVRAALAAAGVEADTIGYVEAHGTATALGDPIEVAALTKAFRAQTDRLGYCALGSVKTNIGHLDPAAGIAGLIKAALMLEHRELVPSLHFERPNPKIDFEASPFYVSTARAPWVSDGRGPRRAGVSSFGLGGTNVHVVLEEAPPPPAPRAPARPCLLVLSAKAPPALERATDALAGHLERTGEASLADAEFTLRQGRRAYARRRAVVCASPDEAARFLRGRDPGRSWSGTAPERGRRVAFLFPGQGAQHVGMGRRLHEREAVFRREVDGACEALRPLLGLDLRPVLFPEPDRAEAAARELTRTRLTQPALFVIEHALARLWMSWGVDPEGMIGHSVGEYVAACVAGVMDRDDALALVAERARLMDECPPGVMLAVALGAEAARARLEGTRLDLAVENAADACVVAGAEADVARLEERLEGEGIVSRRLETSHAFHSALMDPVLVRFGERVGRVRLAPPRLPFVSNLTGTWIAPAQATDPGYWVRHLRETVRFAAGLGTLLEDESRILLEVGPGQTLVSLARRRFESGSKHLALASLPHPRQPEADDAHLLGTAGRLWVAGVDLDWTKGDDGEPTGRRVVLPTYPFEPEVYWVDAGRPAPAAAAAGPADRGARPSLLRPAWKRAADAERPATDGWRVCVFADEGGIGKALAAMLGGEGAEVVQVRPGPSFLREDERRFQVDPASAADHDALVRAVRDSGPPPDRYLHLWGMDALEEGPATDRAFHSVLHLVQALGRRQEEPTRLVVVGEGVQDVLADEPITPVKAMALGPCLVAAQEYPHLSCRHVDLALSGGETRAEALAGRLLAELSPDGAGPVVAHRGRARFVPVYEPFPEPDGPPARLRPGGTYLVTGGLGNVGLALAEAIARRGPARLVLTGREGLPDRATWDERAGRDDATADRIRAVRALEQKGAEVLVLRADASDPDAMKAALAAARARFGPVSGVVHAAGAIDAATLRPLEATSREDCERQFRPKVGGTAALAEALGDLRPDFVLLTSSLSTVLGGLGFAAYAAANHYQDAFARRQHQRGRTEWVSVAWDGWRPRGAKGEGRLSLSARQGAEAFERILGLGRPAQVLVALGDFAGRLASWTRPPGAEAVAAPEGLARYGRPELQTVYVAPESPTERRMAEIWGALLGLDRVGVHDNFFELGGSSLLAVRLVGALKAEFRAELKVATLFEAPTVHALSELVRARGGGDEGLERSRGRGRTRKERSDRARRRVDAPVEPGE